MDALSNVSFWRNEVCNLKDFPRHQDEQNDCGRFRRAIENIPSGGVVLIPPGQYIADNIEIAKEMSLIGLGEVEILSTKPNQDILIVRGASSNTKFQLEKPAHRGDGSVTLTIEPEGIMGRGDMVVLTQQVASQRDDVSQNIEVHEIDSVQGRTITFQDMVYLSKEPAEVNLYKAIPLNYVHIENIRVQLQEGSELGRGIYANYVRNLVIRQFHGKRMAGSLIQVRKAMHVLVEKFSNDSPQKVGSGQGYGVQFYGGASFVTIRDGLTKYCRHSIDLEGTYNALVENVVDMEGLGANFVIVHNGWGTDILFRACRAINSRATGFVVESQGYSDDNQDPYKYSYKYQLYNFHIIDCEVHHKAEYAKSSSALSFSVPVTGTVVSGCTFRHSTGKIPIPDTYGIRMWPCNNQIRVENCTIEGYDRGLCMWLKDVSYKNNSTANKILFRNIQIRNCNSLAFMNYGELKCVQFKAVQGDGIKKYLFETPRNGSYYEFILDGMDIVNSPIARVFSDMPQEYEGEPIRGIISNIQTDRPVEITRKALLALQGKISDDILYLNRSGDSLFLSGKGASTSLEGEVLPNGVVQGQRITLLAAPTSQKWVINKGSNLRFSNKADFIQLGEDRYAITFQWRKSNGKGYWYEIS